MPLYHQEEELRARAREREREKAGQKNTPSAVMM